MLKFEITSQMEKEIKQWDSCIPLDVSGAKFAYTFMPTGIGLIIEVKCDVCKEKFHLMSFKTKGPVHYKNATGSFCFTFDSEIERRLGLDQYIGLSDMGYEVSSNITQITLRFRWLA